MSKKEGKWKNPKPKTRNPNPNTQHQRGKWGKWEKGKKRDREEEKKEGTPAPLFPSAKTHEFIAIGSSARSTLSITTVSKISSFLV